jgi:hypothetical protein
MKAARLVAGGAFMIWSYAGLTRVSIIRKTMDCRIKSGNDRHSR